MKRMTLYKRRQWFTLEVFILLCCCLTMFGLPGRAVSGEDESRHLVIDAEGNVIVTGSSGNGAGFDYVTIKYSPDGAWLWGRRYNSPINGDDYPSALAVDTSGNVYVTGISSNSSGNYDYVTIKYDTNGNWLWGRRYNGPANGQDEATALEVDSSGNVYVTGGSESDTHFDCVTIKYGPDGNWLWGRRYNGPAGRADAALALAVDASDNVVVTGLSVGISTGSDYVTIKYSPDGNWLWGKRYNGFGDGSDVARCLVVDSSGNVHIAGESTGAVTYKDYVTIKYDPDGNWLWGRRYDGLANDDDVPADLAVGGIGNVIVTGSSTGFTQYDYMTIKYSASGDWLWGIRYNGPANADDKAYALTLDVLGNIYVTGETDTGAYGKDFHTVAYTSAGVLTGFRRFDGFGKDDVAYDVALDPDRNIHITGSSQGDWTGNDYVTLKYDSTGSLLWGRRYDAPYPPHY